MPATIARTNRIKQSITKKLPAPRRQPAFDQPQFAVVVTIEGENPTVVGVLSRHMAEATAEVLNRDEWLGMKAVVRPVSITVL